MTPDSANFSGNVHGGLILKLLDQLAHACASRCVVTPWQPSTPDERRRHAAIGTGA